MNQNPTQSNRDAALWARIEEVPLAPAGAALSFGRRLARENGWTLAYTDRVVLEYRRFLFLAAVAGHPVSPSEDVDQAWHLHLAYTESYWNVLCREVLGFPFHHGPARGAPGEHARFVDWYERTRASYRRHVGAEPPADIWPDPERRFADAVAHRRVDLRRYWLLPKPDPRRWLRVAGATAGIASMAGCGTLVAASGLGVFDWEGPAFLGFYAGLIAVLGLVLLWLRRHARGEGEGEDACAEESVDPIEASALADGAPGAIRAALIALAQRGCVQPGTAPSTVVRAEGDPSGASGFERDVLEAMPAGEATRLRGFEARIKEPLARLRDTLVRRGWEAPPETVRMRRASGMIAVLLVAGIGAIKLFIGLERGRPIVFLFFMIMAVLVVGLTLAWRIPRRTQAGQAMLVRLRRRFQNESLRGEMGGFDPLWLAPVLVGLFGTSVLADTEWSAWQGPLLGRRPAWHSDTSFGTANGNGGCSGSSSSGCGGSGGGDGGGCGGGGCGGCGGGGD